jgi:hypothetical protein
MCCRMRASTAGAKKAITVGATGARLWMSVVVGAATTSGGIGCAFPPAWSRYWSPSFTALAISSRLTRDENSAARTLM